MPNWCNNSITITGDYDTLVQLKPVVEAGEGLLQAICPMPKELEGTTAPSDTPNWYDWCNANWGTKWDPEVHLEFIDNEDGTATIQGWFDTAWAPPLEAFQSLADDWDSCYIELFYEEGGMCYMPKTGLVAVSLLSINRPAALLESFCITEPKAPTPGTTKPSAS